MLFGRAFYGQPFEEQNAERTMFHEVTPVILQEADLNSMLLFRGESKPVFRQ